MGAADVHYRTIGFRRSGGVGAACSWDARGRARAIELVNKAKMPKETFVFACH